ncbi:MAG: CGNR zinc finger domain-containing protein [Acidimicrobiia bacterium]
MAPGHPTDEQGRVLPACDWPADKAAPDGLEVIRRFCNTRNCENGADRFESIEGLRRWLDEQRLPAADTDTDIDESGRRRVVAVREHLRQHALAHHDDAAAPALDGRITDVPVALAVDGGRLAVRPAGHDAADLTIGVVALAVLEAQRHDRWRRFKACPSCGWVFYDRSKNRSGRWCSMTACGGRAKVAAFRERRRGDEA